MRKDGIIAINAINKPYCAINRNVNVLKNIKNVNIFKGSPLFTPILIPDCFRKRILNK